jgi:DNA replication and repair protein RecF
MSRGDNGTVHVSHLTLHDFRSYAEIDVALDAGVTAFVGRNGQGKTNLVEAVDYLSRLSSHRVATDAPLIRAGAERALVRAAVVRDGRTAVLEVELNPGKANRARINRSPLSRARDLVGIVRTVVFSPEDLALVKGDPSERRRFLDDLLVLRTPRLAGVRADYDRVLKQRNTLLKTAGNARRGSSNEEAALATLDVWNDHLTRTGGELLHHRLRLVEDLAPYVGKAYEAVARGASRDDARIAYSSGTPLPEEPVPTADTLAEVLLVELVTAGSPWSGRTATTSSSRSAAAPGSGCRSRATRPTASRGRSRWRSDWRPTTCCAPTVTTRS